jgi:hypothetical protein
MQKISSIWVDYKYPIASSGTIRSNLSVLLLEMLDMENLNMVYPIERKDIKANQAKRIDISFYSLLEWTLKYNLLVTQK